jgi:hypothetical protein
MAQTMAARAAGAETLVNATARLVNATILALAKTLCDRGILDGMQVNNVLSGPVRAEGVVAVSRAWASLHDIAVEDATANFPPSPMARRKISPRSLLNEIIDRLSSRLYIDLAFRLSFAGLRSPHPDHFPREAR